MDLDKIMEKIYSRTNIQGREGEALAQYIALLDEYDDNPIEEQKMYLVASTIFPGTQESFEEVKFLRAL